MTPEEIKNIATEIATTLYNEDRTYNHHLWWSVEPKERKAEEVEDIINVILKDYCIVPKSKINALHEEIHGEIMCAHDDDDWQSVSHYILDVMPRSFSDIFGKSFFEEEK